MGCSSSGIPTSPHIHRSQQVVVFDDSYDEEEDRVMSQKHVLSPKEMLIRNVSGILDGISSIPLLPDIDPVVTLTENAFPLVLCDYSFDSQGDSKVILPVIAFSKSDAGKYAVFGSIDFLQHKMILKTEISALIENLAMWGTDYKMKTIKILLFGFQNSLSSSISADLASFGYTVEIGSTLPETLQYDFIFMPTHNCDAASLQRIKEYATKGCVFLFISKKDETKECRTVMNQFLSHTGIAIPICNLKPICEDTPSFSYNKLEEHTFAFLYHKYLNLLEQTDPPLSDIDDIVACLRYYITAFSSNEETVAAEIVSKTWDYLIRENYYDNGIYCKTMTQCVLAVLLSDIVPYISPEKIVTSPAAKMFPGLCGEVECEVRKVKIKLPRNTMISTGMYLPPGHVATIESSSSVTIQIGSHEECLLEKRGEWKRWPIVTSLFNINEGKANVASPFGGIVYIGSQESKSVGVSFTGFCRYPRYSIRKDTWTSTKGSQVPWGEIEMHNLTITLPTRYMLMIQDFDDTVSKLQHLIDTSLAFIGLKVCKCHRIIFDADLVTQYPTYGENVVVLLTDLPNALDAQKPSEELLRIINLIVASSVPENVLDDDALIALSMIAACHAFSVQYPGCNPTNFIDSLPTLFNELWSIASSKPEEFSRGVAAHMIHRFSADTRKEDLWNAFIGELITAVGDNLLALDDRYKMTRMLEGNSSGFLQKFVVTEVDNADKPTEEEE